MSVGVFLEVLVLVTYLVTSRKFIAGGCGDVDGGGRG